MPGSGNLSNPNTRHDSPMSDLPLFDPTRPPDPGDKLADAVADLVHTIRALDDSVNHFGNKTDLLAAVMRGVVAGKPDVTASSDLADKLKATAAAKSPLTT